MTEIELAKILSTGEDSTHRFQRHLEHIDAIARELIALANSAGGTLFVGVDVDGTVEGLSEAEVRDFNRLLDRAATQEVRPSLMPQTENIVTADGIVVAVHVCVSDDPRRAAGPYLDRDGRLWMRCGVENRQVTDREALERIYVASAQVAPERFPIALSKYEDFDEALVEAVMNTQAFPESLRLKNEVAVIEAYRKHRLQSCGFFSSGHITVVGALCCVRSVAEWLPGLTIHAVAVAGNEFGKADSDSAAFTSSFWMGATKRRADRVECTDFAELRESRFIEGTLEHMFHESKRFLAHHLYDEQSTREEIPQEVFDELLVNALVHRDLLIRAPIRLLVFENRVEIASPGTLPQGMTEEELLAGAFLWRNPTLARNAATFLPFWGVGAGLQRVQQMWPQVTFKNDPVRNEFRVIVPRSVAKQKRGNFIEERQAQEALSFNDAMRSDRAGATGMLSVGASDFRATEARGLLETLQTLVTGEMTRSALQEACGYRNRTSFMNAILKPALEAGLLEMTVPEKPQSRNQRYRLTEKAKKRGH